MSIKKLFDASNKTTQYSDYETEKGAYASVESSDNAINIIEEQRTFVPDIDYSNPEKFVFYGSAYLYYKSGFDHVSDFYPYDGSLAEQNAFYNKLLPVEKYIFNKKYPRSTGYAVISANPNSVGEVGWGTQTSTADGYGLPSKLEYITFKGGPHTGSQGTSLKDQSPDEHSSKIDRSNIYDESIYETAGLPTDYGKGTRQSNLHADFDTGVTVEFWLNTGSISTSLTEKQVLFDWWNQEAASSNSYGRILVELTSSTSRNGAAQKPFVVTVMSGTTTTRNFISLGSSKLHYEMSDWKHYAISMVNSGSLFKTKLYVNGKLDDESRRAYDLSAAFRSYNSSTVTSSYSSEESLQGWWRLNDVVGLQWPDSSGKNRNGICDGADLPTVSTSLRPHLYISPSGSATFDGSNDHIEIGTDSLWDSLIGNAEGSTQQMSFAAWIYKTDGTSGTTTRDRIIDFADTDIGFWTDADEKLNFNVKWGAGTSYTWSTANSVIPLSTWTHVAVTYDANSTSNNPVVYVNGAVVAWASSPSSRTGAYYGIIGAGDSDDCLIGDSTSGTGPFKGNIADVAVWNTPVSAADIKTIYSATAMPAKTTALIADLNNKSAIGRIGALQTAPVGTSGAPGAGKLSGSIDEFRFWKAERNAAQVAENHFDRVGGGSNTDISNTTLGVYFKFNEGITGVTATDSIVSDYSGRISNGAWTGYAAQSRNTGSAILSASAAISEYEEPIIRSNHPNYISVRQDLLDVGKFYDSTNHSAFVNHAPSWVLEAHEDTENNNLDVISHIVGSYFDNVHLLTKEFPKFKQVNYVGESGSAIPFANHLPQSLGMYVPDIFVDASVQEQLLNRNDTRIFENNLFDTKNLIYQNLYNNLANIYKAKGTENAFKNVLRCFNIDDDLVQLKIYSDNNIYEVKNNLKQIVSINKSANFNKASQTSAVVYQRSASTNQDSRGFISGSSIQGYTGGAYEKNYGFTAEADVIFPKFFNTKDRVDRSFTQVSLFGAVQLAHPVNPAHQKGTNTSTPRTGSISRLANFQVYAVRDASNSKNVRFKLESSGSANPFPTLTSSLFKGVYDNNRWNLSVRLKPKSVGLTGFVSGSSLGYDLIFRGVHSVLGTIKDSFQVSSSISATTGSNFLTNHKRLYAGAYRNNLTGTLVSNSDVKISNVKYWAKHLENSDLELHLYDVNNSGVSGSYKNISALDTSTNMVDNLNKDTLVLEWNFDALTSSNAAGNFVTQDFSSGSSVIRENYGWLGKLTGYQYSGYGNFFDASSTNVIDRERVNSFKFVDPEEVVSSEMISILNDDDELLGFEQTIPNYVITAEKSMYRAISEEMLIFFSGIVDFNNTIGAPVNRYRGRYKDLEKLREAFFRRVKDTKDIEKFINYYKWFDTAITEIFSQLVPASANFVDGITNLVESHVLERNKYRTPFPTLEAKQPDPEAAMYGVGEKNYPYETGFTTLPTSPRKTTKQVDYWKMRAERSSVEISSGDANIDNQREKFREVINSRPVLSSSRDNIIVSNASTKYTPKKFANKNFQQTNIFSSDIPNARTYKGGTNFSIDKNIEFSKAALYPGGPVNQKGGVFVPQNILLSFNDDFLAITDFKDPSKTPAKKIKRVVPVDYGRHHDDKDGYYHVKSSKAFPFNIISSSLNSGYQSDVQAGLGLNIEITNLHNDVYGEDQEKPLQGIFTEHNVGGNQHRHTPLNTGTDNNNNRPEAWRILLGACAASVSGAIGMVGADYPMSPDYVAPPGANQPYPHADYPRATHYRDMVAKRPFNFKNIRITGSTKLGNYTNTYEIVSTFGAHSNPRQFIENLPVLPTNVFQGAATSSTSVRTFLDTKPTRDYDTVDREHFNFVNEYNVGYLTGTANKSVIKTKFSAPGGIEVMTPGYTDFRADEFSVYNALNYKNLSVLKPSQGPSGTISETYGIRVNDIHNLDFGLRSHLARHTARFGRDSNLALNPGASYAELPGMHKVHRNNLQRDKVLTETVVGVRTGPRLINDKSLYWGTDASRGMQLINADSASASTFLTSSRASGFSYAAWIRFSPAFNQGHLYNLGKSGAGGDPFFEIKKNYVSNAHRLELFARTRATDPHGGTAALAQYYITSSVLDDGNWHHLAVVCPTSSTNGAGYIGTDVAMYIDGAALNVITGTSPNNRFDAKRVVGTYQVRSKVKRDGQTALVIGGQSDGTGTGGGSSIFTGSMDQVTLWVGSLRATDVAALYNGGTPCDVTSSAPYVSSSATLYAWYKMGGAERDDKLNTSNTGVFVSGSNVVWDWKPENSRNLFPMSAVNTNFNTLTMSNAYRNEIPAPLAGCTPPISRYETQRTFKSSSLYDNFFVKHQIPRSSRQYAWITASLVSTNGHVGFVPTDFKISSSAGYIDAYNFVSASEIGSYDPTMAARRFGYRASNGAGYLQQVSDLNLNIYEPLTSSTNTLGQGTTHIIDYINNADALVKVVPLSRSPNAFNNLMFKRGNQYGFPSWKQTRQAQHPIIREQRKENKLQIMIDQAPRTYNMQPVSFRQKIQEIGIQDVTGQRHKLKTTHQPQYFATTELDNRLISVTANERVTPLQAVVIASYQAPSITNINYIKYSEASYPASRNEFVSHSTQRLNYSNDYWHSNREQRNILGADLYTGTYFTQVTGAYVRTSALGYKVSASAWALDAPTHFLTRRGPSAENKNTAQIIARWGEAPQRNYDWLGTGSAGELQNDWQSFFIESNKYPGAPTGQGTFFARDVYRAYNAVASPLYARKHLLSSPLSVINPNSITNTLAGRNGVAPNSQTARLGFSRAAGPAATPWLISSASEIFAGEALWEANKNAVIISDVLPNYKDQGRTRYRGKFTPTAPAYDSYAKFVESIRLQSRGRSIVPEYRISRNLPDYLSYGSPFSEGKQDYFDIPGSSINSSQQGFYIDYSNSDFLKYFAEVGSNSGLNPAEIRLVCSASIKFHPYKGFFPSQRTMDLVSEFKNSYENHARTKVKIAAAAGSNAYAGKNVFNVVPGGFRPVMQTYFAPGILYNTIKSGIAVDYPILYNRYKMLVGSHYINTSYTASTGDYAATTTNCGPHVPIMSDYMINTRTEEFMTASSSGSLEKGVVPANRLDRGYGSFWDQRVPFEAIIEPNMMANTQFADCEAHPSATINAVASYEASSDPTYTLMAKNFFGGVADFYLKNSEFTSLKSETVYKDDYRFETGSVFMARVKMRRSVTGSRDYSFESGSFMPESYTQGGGTALLPRLSTGPTDTAAIMYDQGSYFELPQDPMFAPTAFGPPVAGHAGNVTSSHSYFPTTSQGLTPISAYTSSAHRSGSGDTYQIMDSVKGYNWSFTPPYYHGESWADLIFRPKGDVAYDLERILAETTVNYWRVDPGPKLKGYGITYSANHISSQVGASGSIGSNTSYRPKYGYIANQEYTSLIHDPKYKGQGEVVSTAPYAGSSINGNSMQLSASLNLFGVERVFKETTGTSANSANNANGLKSDVAAEQTNEVVGKRWIISTKFETPMLNFSDKYQQMPVSSSIDRTKGNVLLNYRTSTKTLPTFGSASAPNGMWHQFGEIPRDKKTGVFVEIDDMPKNWLRNHYQVRLSGSIYNDGIPDYAGALAKEGQVGSLRDLCGFKKTKTNSRIGELKDSHTINEAIVAIPYVVESTSENLKDSQTFSNFNGKYLFRLPAAGESTSPDAAAVINKQTQTMNKYILPPQFDFINYPDNAAPVVMYFFEFSYTFDKDDLSYMWQNLMPRNHEKGFFKTAVAEHRLSAGYPLEAGDILNNTNMRWMVFKVKQRSQADYYDYVNRQAGSSETISRDDDSPMQFNWPYDFCSIIESINMDTEVLFNNRPENSGKNTSVNYGGSISSEGNITAASAATYTASPTQSLATIPSGQVLNTNVSATRTQMSSAPTQAAAPAATAGAPSGNNIGNY